MLQIFFLKQKISFNCNLNILDINCNDVENEIIKISQFDTCTLNIIFGWCGNMTKPFDQTKILKSDLEYWEVLWFDYATKALQQDIFNIVKAADFYDIPHLLTSLTIFIGKELQNKSTDLVYSLLFENPIYIPHRFGEKCLYQILAQKLECELLQINYVTLRVVNSIFSIHDCVNKHNERWLAFDDFVFLNMLHGNHIRYDPLNVNLITDLLYQDVSLNLGHLKYVREIMKYYLNDEDLNDAMVAGGIFWDYQSESLFAKAFPSLFEEFKAKQDVDIYILDDAKNSKFSNYYDRIFEPSWEAQRTKYNDNYNDNITKQYDYLYENYAENDKIYDGVNSFKIKHPDGQSINFIFISKDDYASTVLFLNTFDFSISKTYYSYYMDALYFPIEIFGETARMSSKYFKKIRCEDVKTIVNSVNKFAKFYELLLELLEFELDPDSYIAYRESLHVKFNYDEVIAAKEKYFLRKMTEFLNVFGGQLKLLSKCQKNLHRIFKYGFKNNFKTFTDCEVTLSKIKLFYRVFKKQIDEKNFTNENMANSIFKYILESKLN